MWCGGVHCPAREGYCLHVVPWGYMDFNSVYDGHMCHNNIYIKRLNESLNLCF